MGEDTKHLVNWGKLETGARAAAPLTFLGLLASRISFLSFKNLKPIVPLPGALSREEAGRKLKADCRGHRERLSGLQWPEQVHAIPVLSPKEQLAPSEKQRSDPSLACRASHACQARACPVPATLVLPLHFRERLLGSQPSAGMDPVLLAAASTRGGSCQSLH